nr:hypothetical protein [Tanacetum cinerariifolium]
MGKNNHNKKRAMENLNLFYQKIRPSSSAGGHLTQEEAEKEPLAIRISQKFSLLEEERHKAVSFLGSLPVPLKQVNWKPDYKGSYTKEEEATRQWRTKIRLTDPYRNIYLQGFKTRKTDQKLSNGKEDEDDENDFVDKSDGNDDGGGGSDDHDEDSDDERTKSNRAEIPDPNLTIVDQTEHEEEDVDERVHTLSDYELTDDEKIHDEEYIDDEEEEDEVIRSCTKT